MGSVGTNERDESISGMGGAVFSCGQSPQPVRPSNSERTIAPGSRRSLSARDTMQPTLRDIPSPLTEKKGGNYVVAGAAGTCLRRAGPRTGLPEIQEGIRETDA